MTHQLTVPLFDQASCEMEKKLMALIFVKKIIFPPRFTWLAVCYSCPIWSETVHKLTAFLVWCNPVPSACTPLVHIIICTSPIKPNPELVLHVFVSFFRVTCHCQLAFHWAAFPSQNIWECCHAWWMSSCFGIIIIVTYVQTVQYFTWYIVVDAERWAVFYAGSKCCLS